ncbi:MAG: RnfABCDGE type electron transport complex subunit D [Candidatus Aminicenantes bacterium]|jgi:electron transport complex protein RnfD
MKLTVSSPPHWHVKLTEGRIHVDFIIALIPAAIFAIYTYGTHAVRVITLAMAIAVISEIFTRKLFKKPMTYTDGSAFFIGLLFAMILPPSVPFWLVIIGTFLCIFIGKELFGGLGSHPLNPVLVGWTIIYISWPAYLNINLAAANYDLGYTFYYPLAMLKNAGIDAVSDIRLIDLILGKQTAGLGASAIILIFIGGIYLLVRKRIAWEISLSYAVGIVLMAAIFWAGDPTTYINPLFHLFTGNAMIGIFFLATDYSSSPSNRWGMVAFGLGCGFLTIILRVWSINPHAVPFAILIMSLFTPLLDKMKRKPKPIKVYYMEKGLS